MTFLLDTAVRTGDPIARRGGFDSSMIQFRDGATWTFRMPLYSVLFRGDSPSRPEVWVRMGPSETSWNILVRPGVDDKRLVPVVAFLHSERCPFG